MTVFVVEGIEGSRQRELFTLLGVHYYATSRWWVNLPLVAIIGIVIALIYSPTNQLLPQVLVGIGYGVLIMLSSFCHGWGHIISSRIVNAPVDAMLITATVQVTQYDDDEEQPSRVHVGRSLGGPVLNLLLGLTATALHLFVANNHFLLVFGVVNLAFGVMTLLPIPSLDGSVIWRELRDRRQ